MILYKYRGNSDFTDKIFTDKKVWLSNAAGLNDPFECTIQQIAKDWIEEDIKKLKYGHMGGFIHSALSASRTGKYFYDLNPKQTKEFLEKFKKKDFDAKYKTVREFTFRKTGKQLSNPEEIYVNFDKQLNNVGIFSLSATDQNQLMWAHYGENSKGIAIGFDVEENSKLSDRNHCLKVNYSDDLPAFDRDGFITEVVFFLSSRDNIQKISFKDPTFQQAISTKPKCWEYEQEWRYVEEISGAFDLPSKISEVVFGLKCPNELRRKYIDLVEKNFDYKIYFYEIVNLANTNQIAKVECKI